MISQEDLKEKLSGYPEVIFQHYQSYLETQKAEALNEFVLGLIRFFQDENEVPPMEELSDTTEIRKDLGVDSVTIAEIVFLIEEVFEIEIDNEDLMQLNTIGELREYIIRKVGE